MDWHSILETTFMVMFWIGLVLTVVMAVMSGAFHSEIGAGSSFEGGVAHDLGGPHIDAAHAGSLQPGTAEVGWSEGEIPGFSPWSPTVICATLTGAGGLGWLAIGTWNLGVGGSIAVGLLGGLGLGGATFGALAFLFKHLQSSSHISSVGLIGTRASVGTAIDSAASGAIVIVASGSRMVVPARSVDAAAIPEGAEVEIVRVDGAVYHVKETRESWLARSKGAAH
jgi:hypothetical protein